MKKNLHIALIFFLLLINAAGAQAQTIIKGIVRDAATKQPLQSVSVYADNGNGVATSENGSYVYATNNAATKSIQFSYIGYKAITKTVSSNQEQTLDVELELEDATNNVVIKARRGKYSNKSNPAVELIRKVIENKSKNRISNYDYVAYEQYEKMELSLTNKPEKLLKKIILKDFNFAFDNVDTSKIAGTYLLPVYMSEKLSQNYYRKNPETNKTIVLGNKQVDYGEFIDNNGIKTYLNRLYEDVDIYEKQHLISYKPVFKPHS